MKGIYVLYSMNCCVCDEVLKDWIAEEKRIPDEAMFFEHGLAYGHEVDWIVNIGVICLSCETRLRAEPSVMVELTE